jgi:hypothetical protein
MSERAPNPASDDVNREAKTLAVGHPVAQAVFRSSFADLSEEERSTLLALLLRTATEESD